jgi:hypothetical protein
VSNEPPFNFLGKRGLQRRNKKWARRARASRRTHEKKKTGVFVLVAIVCLAGLTGLTGLAVGLYFLLRPKSEPSPTSTPKPEAATIKPLISTTPPQKAQRSGSLSTDARRARSEAAIGCAALNAKKIRRWPRSARRAFDSGEYGEEEVRCTLCDEITKRPPPNPCTVSPDGRFACRGPACSVEPGTTYEGPLT